jgi:hypothetical protein
VSIYLQQTHFSVNFLSTTMVGQASESEHSLTQLKSPTSNYGQIYKNLPWIGYNVVPTSGDDKAATLMTRCRHAIFNYKGNRRKVTLSNGPRNRTKPTEQHAALDMVIRWWSDPVVCIDLSVRGFVLTVAELSRLVCYPSRAAPELYVQKGRKINIWRILIFFDFLELSSLAYFTLKN